MSDEDAEAAKAAKAEFLASQRQQNAKSRLKRRQDQVAVVNELSKAAAAPPVWGLEQVLESAEGLKALREFCEQELSEENLEFLLAARAWGLVAASLRGVARGMDGWRCARAQLASGQLFRWRPQPGFAAAGGRPP